MYLFEKNFKGLLVQILVATSMMIFGLVACAKIYLHSPSSIIRSAIHWVLNTLDFFVDKLGKLEGDNLGTLGGNMWLWGVL